MIDAAKLVTFAPHIWEGYTHAFVAGTAELDAAGINTPLRVSHFMAQCAHESTGFTIARENTRWTGDQMRRLWPKKFPLGPADPRILNARGDDEKLANLAYGKDGYKYRGGGIIQLTGRANYAAAGDATGVDLETYPEQIEDPAVALKAALWFWTSHDLNRFADHNYGRAIGNGINRGNPYSSHDPIGYEDRSRWFAWAWRTWGDGELPSQDTLWLGAHGRKVLQVQTRLRDLGYPVGALDGVFGPAMARAVAGFKVDARRAGAVLEGEDDSVGPATLAALDSAGPAPLSAERTGATERDLAAAGSTEVAAGRKGKAAGQAALYTGATLLADMLGVLDGIKRGLSSITALHATAVPALSALQWGLRYLLPIALIVGGVWAWRAFGDVIVARLTAHRSGANLGR